MNLIITTPEAAAAQAADLYVALLKNKPNAVLGLATGSTPLALYARLAALHRAGALSFRDVTSFNLDEYAGLPPTHDQSYRYFMEQNLFRHIDLPAERVHVPSGLDVSEGALAGYDAAIDAAGGLDLQLLGLGTNSHIGFNEPGTPFELGTHVVELTNRTRRDNARFFASLEDVPTHAATMGIKTVMHARAILLLAFGTAKAEAVRASFAGPVTTDVPASVLQLHPNVTVFCDEEAASLL